MVNLLRYYINNMTIGHQIIVKELLRKLSTIGIVILGISFLSGILFLLIKYPPIYPEPVPGEYPPIYNPYPSIDRHFEGFEEEYNMWRYAKELEYRRSV